MRIGTSSDASDNASNDASDNANCNTSAKNLALMVLAHDQDVLLF